MATSFQKEVRPVDIKQLQIELNGTPNISATVLSIDEDTEATSGANLTINWNQDLTVAEETEMDTVISNYVYQPEEIDVKQLPFSELGNKLAVHSSAKPVKSNKELYTVWTGAGDDIVNHVLGDGPLIHVETVVDQPTVVFDVEFDNMFGDVYVHQGLVFWNNGGVGDTVDMYVVAHPTQLQTVANLDLIVENNLVKYSTGGPGTGTHGFAANPILLPRTASKDGNWDYDPVNGLQPNFSGTGMYDISTLERQVHRYVNKLIVMGTGQTLLQSSETAYIPPGYFIRITLNNSSNTVWSFCCMLELFRETTFVP